VQRLRLRGGRVQTEGKWGTKNTEWEQLSKGSFQKGEKGLYGSWQGGRTLDVSVKGAKEPLRQIVRKLASAAVSWKSREGQRGVAVLKWVEIHVQRNICKGEGPTGSDQRAVIGGRDGTEWHGRRQSPIV